MVRKPAKMYRQPKGQPYTRREYMGGVPNPRIAQFDMGNPQGEFPLTIRLVAEEACQIRHNALEAARIAANRFISRRAGQQYHLRIQPFPHIVLRENKVAVGAGADRISDGMRGSFGTPVGMAARVRRDQTVLFIRTTPSYLDRAKQALKKAGYKLPTPTRIVVEAS
ncbi:MAG: 50S ribosomal protein L16 [Thermoplasmata archaeon]|nr:50S ribosomal protein L16 [Thermoplasmata archaeon]